MIYCIHTVQYYSLLNLLKGNDLPGELPKSCGDAVDHLMIYKSHRNFSLNRTSSIASRTLFSLTMSSTIFLALETCSAESFVN